MGVEFRLTRNDHLVVESFLRRPTGGVAGIQVEARHVERQQGAIEAAVAAGLDVTIDPLTERLVADGYDASRLNYYDREGPLDPAVDLARRHQREEFVDRVLAVQVDRASLLTPPHFFVEHDEAVDLNLSLLRTAIRRQPDAPVRPILAVQRSFIAKPNTAALIAGRYAHEGATRIELWISPVGGEDEGTQKVRSTLETVAAFRNAGLDVVLGRQGALGETALALGVASRFSVGIGLMERFNHKSAMANQRRPAEGGTMGPQAGVYVPEASVTISRKLARELYSDARIRSLIACRLPCCSRQIEGPVKDPRRHYLTTRAHDVNRISQQPGPWRPNLQRDRLQTALERREVLNKHLPSGAPRVKTRTILALLDELDARSAAAA